MFCLGQMRNIKPFVKVLVVLVELYSSVNAKIFRDMTILSHLLYIVETKRMKLKDVYLGKLLDHSSGAVSWAVHPNEPSGFHGCKAILNHALALVSACP